MLDNYPDVLSFRQVMEITHVGRNLLLYKQDLIQYMSQCQ